jgi:diguanylate cyclase (GGDEF)-like protein
MASTPDPRPRPLALHQERNLRISTAIAMWVGGAAALAAGALLGALAPDQAPLAWGVVGWSISVALFTALVFPRRSDRTLHILTNAFCALGAITVSFGILISGGAGSPYIELLLFPALYAAYFFSARGMIAHLAFYSALLFGVAMLEPAPDASFVATRLLIVVAGAWAISTVITWHHVRLLAAEASAREQALRDPLTGAHNLRGLRAEVEAAPLGPGTGLLLIDIDNFKGVNSHFGHTGADRLLTQIAEELAGAAGDRACVARIGGDEFVVLVRDRDAGAITSLVTACEEATNRARAATGLPGFDLTASVGSATWPSAGDDLSSLMDAADHEMLARKRDSRRGRVDAAIAELAAPTHDRPHAVIALPTAQTPATPARAPRDAAAWIGARPPRMLAGAIAWLAAAIATGAVLLLSADDLAYPEVVAVLAGSGVIAAAMLLILGSRFEARVAFLSDLCAVVCLVVIIALTGGPTSPMLPFILLPIAISAYFASTREAIAQLVVGIAVCATPLLYADADEWIAYCVRFVALASTAMVLTLVISRSRHALDAAERSAREQALHDPLTRLPNRRTFTARLGAALAKAETSGTDGVCAAIIDLDNFKRVNDRHGHATGDRLLRGIGEALGTVVRTGDTIARVGGDEFAIVAPGTDLETARVLGERCVTTVEAVAEKLGCADCGVSATVGFALHRRDADTADELIAAADTALLQAKDAGKRRVACLDRAAA